MFERFTDRARRVVVLAQEEARVLNHNYIGTEHLLLGLIREGEGVAARVLESLDISLEVARREIEEIIGSGGQSPSGHIPFTPRAKKVLELALREALQLGHNYIGTEHVLLGLIREGEGVAAQVLHKLGADLSRVRHEVAQILEGGGSDVDESRDEADGRALQPECSFCGRELSESPHYVRAEAAAICDECIEVAHAAIKAAPEGQHVLVLPARVSGVAPDAHAVDEIVEVVQRVFATVDPRAMIANVEPGPELLETAERLLASRPTVSPFSVRVDRVRFLDDTDAAVRIAHTAGEATLHNYEVSVVRIGGRWLISRNTFLSMMTTLSRYPI